jgi:hypothetical protein
MRIIGCDLHARQQTIYEGFCIGIFDNIIAISSTAFCRAVGLLCGSQTYFFKGDAAQVLRDSNEGASVLFF